MEPWLDDGDVRLYLGDCVEVMAAMDAESVDAVVCDPPYGLEFMGKDWDSFRIDDPGTNRNRGDRAGGQGGVSAESRVAGCRVSYGGGKRPTTSRCTGCGKRDQWRNAHDCTRHARWVIEVIDPYAAPPASLAFSEWVREWAREALRVVKPGGHLLAFGGPRMFHRLTCGMEDAGFEIRDCLSWLYGSGFPKSLDVSKAIDKAAGAERERVGNGASSCPGLAAGGECECADRDGDERSLSNGTVHAPATAPATEAAREWQGWGTALKPAWEPCVVARKPPAGTVAENVQQHGTGALNIDGCRIHGADAAAGRTRHGGGIPGNGTSYELPDVGQPMPAGRWPANVALDEQAAAMLDAQGGASRFYYTAKASRADRNTSGANNTHPTVKPTALMRWLVRLVTPPGGIVLDPFAGSGSTLVAARSEGVRAIGIEQAEEYAAIIRDRLAQLSLFSEGME